MNTDSQLQRNAAGERQPEFSSMGAWMTPEEALAARSRENILRWSSYLPKACVKAMIKMGWDKST
ncbi:MAG TPA: hypothetical protein VK794_09100 [Steroidobacteraceae bacterium]|jgi:hypothetical protein|nr:hypothetical protein [Steroidobacteraceae bacterium]